MPQSPQQLRQQQKREEKLKDIRDQVKEGTLVIRQMTKEERKRYPPRDPAPRTRGSRSRG